jgi:hypothetical protein
MRWVLRPSGAERRVAQIGERPETQRGIRARIASMLSTCGFSKLNPQGFIGGFERIAIARLDGDADKRSAAARLPRTPNPNCAAVGGYRAAPSNCRARAQRNSSPVLSPLGSTALDLVLALVAPMARQPDHQVEGQNSRGGPFFAIKSVLSASIPQNGRRDVLTYMVSPVGLRANDPWWRRLLRANNS